MESSAVPEALVTVRAAKDKMKGKSEGKGRTGSFILQRGQREVAQTTISQTFAGQVGCENSQVNMS